MTTTDMNFTMEVADDARTLRYVASSEIQDV
jgi:hypothetical protein